MRHHFTLNDVKRNHGSLKIDWTSVTSLDEDTFMHKAENPSNYFSNSFTHNLAEQIKKRVNCFKILLEIHLTEHNFIYTTILVTVM